MVFTQNVFAQDQHAELKFDGQPTYKILEEFRRGDVIVGYSFQIDIRIQNIGKLRSDEIKINLTDEEGFVLVNNTFFDPGETKTISFTWSTLSDIDQNIIVRYFPANLDTEKTVFNTGKTNFKLVIGEEDYIPGTSTGIPGFELILIIFAVITIVTLKRKKKK